MKMESLQQRREELERKEYQLKESLLKFDKFLKVSSKCVWIGLSTVVLLTEAVVMFYRSEVF